MIRKRLTARIKEMRSAAKEVEVTVGRRTFTLPKKLNSTEIRLLSNLAIGEREQVVRNPFSGRSERLHPVAVALYDFIIGCQMMGGPRGSMIRDFDTAMGIFGKCWPKEYMTLLD